LEGGCYLWATDKPVDWLVVPRRRQLPGTVERNSVRVRQQLCRCGVTWNEKLNRSEQNNTGFRPVFASVS
jgi:hypothetical protein